MEIVQTLGDKEAVLPLADFFLPPGDSYLDSELSRQAAVRDEGLENVDMTWRSSLLAMCRRKGYELDRLDLPSDLATAPGVASLCRRQR